MRDGWRSSMPSSVRSAASSHSGGTQAMCVITLVRWFGRRGSRRRRGAHAGELRSISAIDDVLALPGLEHLGARQCRRQDRPSRCSSSSADGGPHVPAA